MCECGRGCLKGTSMFFNVFFLLSGLMMLFMSIWMAVNDNFHYALIMDDPVLGDDATFYNWIVFGLMVIALCIIFASILGMIGVGCDSVGTIIAFLVFGSIAITSTIIYGSIATYKFKHMDDGTPLEMYRNLHALYKGENNSDYFSDAWNNIQVSERCCGAYNYTDYHGSFYTNSTKQVVPWTCCMMKRTDIIDINQVENLTACRKEATEPGGQTKPYLNPNGCGRERVQSLTQQGRIIYALIWTCVSIQFSGMVWSGWLKNNLKYDKIDPQ